MCVFFFFQAEDGIRDLVRSRGLGDVYKRQVEIGLRGSRRPGRGEPREEFERGLLVGRVAGLHLSLIHI